MNKTISMVIALLCMMVQGAWALTYVSNAEQLIDAGKNGGDVRLSDNITLSTTLVVSEGKTLSLDLNGYTLSRGLESDGGTTGHVIEVQQHATLTIDDNATNGTITGGYSDCGGAIYNRGIVTINGGTICDNHATTNGGAICNRGVMTINGGTISGNVSPDGGAIYNETSVATEYIGTLTITGGTISGNTVTTYGGGAITNKGTLVLRGGTISGNTCAMRGAGIWSNKKLKMTGGTITNNTSTLNGGGIYIAGGSLEMSLNPVVSGNSGTNGANVSLSTGTLISVIGAFTAGANVGVSRNEGQGTFTSGFKNRNHDINPNTVFTSDETAFEVLLVSNEAVLKKQTTLSEDVMYIDETGRQFYQSGCILMSSIPDNAERLNEGWYVVDKDLTFNKSIIWTGTTNLILMDHTTLKANDGIMTTGTLHVWGQSDGKEYTGYIEATTNRESYGGFHGVALHFHSGSIMATGGFHGAGIAGAIADFSTVGITISGGTVFGISGLGGAGIGGGFGFVCPNITITGGEVVAMSLPESIWGGAGIGCGTKGFIWHKSPYGYNPVDDDRTTIRITGGKVFAMGSWGAGIGSASSNDRNEGAGAHIIIEGGRVEAETFSDLEPPRGGAIALGWGDLTGNALSAYNFSMTPEIYSNSKVSYSTKVLGDYTTYNSSQRDWDHLYGYWKRVIIEPCDHSGATYSDNGDGTHTMTCPFCEGLTEAHNIINPAGRCVCTAEVGTTGSRYISIATYDPSQSSYRWVTAAGVKEDSDYRLPQTEDVEGYEFEGWVIDPADGTLESPLKADGEVLYQPGYVLAIRNNVMLAARYVAKASSLTLYDDSNNTFNLIQNDDEKLSVTLAGRTLYKDYSWNTLCLPFSLSEEQIAASDLAGATIKTLSSSQFNSEKGELTLIFSDASNIEAGKPYIVKWEGDGTNNIFEPTFEGVTISIEVKDIFSTINDDMSITFCGTYKPVSFGEEGDNTVLYLGADNTLYYPSGAMSIGAQRAYFKLNGLSAGPASTGSQIKAFNLNFGEEMGIREISKESGSQGENDGWFTIDGTRLLEKPTTKGLYIHNGQKVLIK